MNESSFAEHKIKFSVQSTPRFRDCRGVCQHGHGSLHLRQITTWYYSWWLVIDSYLYPNQNVKIDAESSIRNILK